MEVSELGVSPQCVEIISGILLCPRTEACRDLIKRPALCLRDLEVGEDEEHQQKDGENDENVRARQMLLGEEREDNVNI